MKLKTILLASVVTLLFSACDFIPIFDSDDDDPSGEPSDVLLQVDITGGLAYTNRTFTIERSGEAQVIDHVNGDAERHLLFSEATIDSLRAFMQANDYFDLDDRYIQEGTADVFFYNITYTDSGKTKVIFTDDVAGPDNLRRIVDRINELQWRLVNNGLKLELALSSDTLRSGDSLDVTLSLTNVGDSSLTLRFFSGQIFDFFAAAADAPETVLWRWSRGRAFITVVWETELAPGETRAYRESWDGRSNDGEQLLGPLVVGAELVSTPGGRPPLQDLTIVATRE